MSSVRWRPPGGSLAATTRSPASWSASPAPSRTASRLPTSRTSLWWRVIAAAGSASGSWRRWSSAAMGRSSDGCCTPRMRMTSTGASASGRRTRRFWSAMPLEGEYEPSTADWVRKQVEEYEVSGGTEATTLRDSGLPVVIVTNRGARSGKLRKTPLMRVEHDGRYAAVASQGGAPEHPAWYENLRAHPLVELQDGPRKQDMTARELTGAERTEWWERAVAAFPSYADYQRRTERVIPVFLLEPVEAP